MVRLNKIYTRTGDDGYTGLANGQRCLKCDTRIAAIGAVDQANSAIGLVRAYLAQRLSMPQHSEIDRLLSHIQHHLFDLGADLATPEEKEKKASPALRIKPAQILWLEENIDRITAQLDPLRSFVLPGGSFESATLHLARTSVRQAECLMVELWQKNEHTCALARQYVNRLSDFLFVAARFMNNGGKDDILWVPGTDQ